MFPLKHYGVAPHWHPEFERREHSVMDMGSHHLGNDHTPETVRAQLTRQRDLWISRYGVEECWYRDGFDSRREDAAPHPLWRSWRVLTDQLNAAIRAAIFASEVSIEAATEIDRLLTVSKAALDAAVIDPEAFEIFKAWQLEPAQRGNRAPWTAHW